MCTYNICLFNKGVFHHKLCLTNSQPLSLIQRNEHIEMNNFSCSLSCTWMTIIDLFYASGSYLEMFHWSILLTLKTPITTAADDKFCNIFANFREKLGMIFHENCLPADDSHEISCLICYF